MLMAAAAGGLQQRAATSLGIRILDTTPSSRIDVNIIILLDPNMGLFIAIIIIDRDTS